MRVLPFLLVAAVVCGPALADEKPVVMVKVISEGFEVALPDIRVTVTDATGKRHDATSDAKGEIRIAGLAPGTADVTAVGRGWVARWELVEEIPAKGEHEVLLRMRTAVPLQGRIRSADTGLPVAGARVTAVAGGRINETQGWSTSSRGAYATVETDAEGVFSFDALAEGEVCTLAVLASGFAYEARGVIPTKRRPELEFLLRRGGILRGRVVDANGAAVEGATVYVAPEDDKHLAKRPWGSRIGKRTVSLPGRSDAGGNFEVVGLSFDRRWVAAATAEGHVPSEIRNGILVARDAAEVGIELQLRKAGTIVVRVTDAEGKAVPSGSVSRGGMVSRRITVPLDAEGVARLEGVGPGRHRCQVRAEGFFPQNPTATLGLGETKEIAVELTRLAPPVSITGVAIDDDGKAIAGLEVGTSSPTGYVPKAATTDSQGRFTCTGLQPGKVTVIGSGTGYEKANVKVVAPAADVKLIVPRGGLLKGQVVLREGLTPSPFFTVSIGGLEPGAREVHWTRPFLEDGRFDAPIVPDVPARIRIHSGTFAPWTKEVTVARGEVLDLGRIEAPSGRTLSGTLVDADGAPVADAVVSLSPAILINRTATTDAAGRFEMKYLPGGPLDVAIMAPGHEWESRELDLPETHEDVSIVLKLSR